MDLGKGPTREEGDLVKIENKGSLNTGAHFFIKDQCFQGRLIIQQKPIKNWGDWANNELFTVKIAPTLTQLGDSEVKSYHKRHPYLFYINNRLQFSTVSWEDALEYVTYRFERKTKPLGFSALNIEKQFLKNEPTITFGEVHKILANAGVVLE